MLIKKRNGELVQFDGSKIEKAIMKCFAGSDNPENKEVPFEKKSELEQETYRLDARLIAQTIEQELQTKGEDTSVEAVQDMVEQQLMKRHPESALAYAKFRYIRQHIRESENALMKQIGEIVSTPAIESDMKRSNANIDGDSSMGAMLQFGTTAAKAYNAAYLLTPQQAAAHKNGDIHIHDFDFYALTTTCTQIDLTRLFTNGFNTGHGYLREPNSIGSYAALAAIAIQSNQNDQHGGQSVPAFDYDMANGVRKTYRKEFQKELIARYEDMRNLEPGAGKEDVKRALDATQKTATLTNHEEFDHELQENLMVYAFGRLDKELMGDVSKMIARSHVRAYQATDRATYQAMEGFIHNLNTMHSRAGAQTPFSSVNYGTDVSEEGRMVIRNLLLAEDAGLGNGETPIFPIHIFKVKEGVNYNEGDPNYDLFKLSMKVSAKRLFPNYVFLDAPQNIGYYKPGHPETEVATMGCRTRVMGNMYDPDNEISFSRGNLSFTSINLPRLAIEADHDEEVFYKKLDDMLELVAQQLDDRFEIQGRRHVYNYPFLMGQGIWLGSDKLKPTDTVREVLKHGTLSIGFIGLAEALTALYGHHHGESEEMQQKGLEIISHMRVFCDIRSKEKKMNYTLLATPAEGLSGRFTRMDREKYGVIPGVTDREYYTNSFHIPVWYPISAFDKIQKEGPYHNLCNAGHISYVELDGDTANNLEAFEAVVRCMHDAGVGYGSINHPVDRDPVCGYVGVIGDVCPRCGRRAGEPLTPEQLENLRRKFPQAPIFMH